MKRRLQSILLISLLLASTNVIGATPNLSMLSLFSNESVTSDPIHGGRITLGFDDERLSATASIRYNHPDTNVTAHITKRLHGNDSLLRGDFLGNLAYFSHAQYNGATSLTVAYALMARTPFKDWPTLLLASIGVHGISSWSKSYDRNLYSIAPHISLSVSQTFFDRLVMNLFVTTDTLCLPVGNLAYYYGLSVALALTENLIVQVRPLVRLSDYPNESVFVTYREFSVSVCWTDASNRRHVMQALGVWL